MNTITTQLPVLLTPRPYQIEAARFALKEAEGKVILADEMGLGKTGEVYLAWREAGYPMPCLIIAGINAQLTWSRQAPEWGCPIPVSIKGNAAQRKALWSACGREFVICTREALKRDLKAGLFSITQFRCVISDECHKDSNRKTGNWRTLKALGQHAQYIFLTSGSIMRRGPQSLWGLLNVVRPARYGSYWKFINQYCEVSHGQFGLEIIGPKNAGELQWALAKIMISRTKRDVRPELPPKIRDMNSCVLNMTTGQEKMYEELVEDSIAELPGGGMLVVPSILAKLQRLRQVLVTPKLLDPQAEDGAGLDRIVEMLEESNDRHMCIFTPFASALPYIRSRLCAEGFEEDKIVLLSGGLSAEELMLRISHFRRSRGIAICSIQYAESFDLQPASWAVFLGYSWDAWDNLQAEDRLHRGDIINPVNIYYISHQGGIDQGLIQAALDTKVNNVMAILKDVDKIRQALKGGAVKS